MQWRPAAGSRGYTETVRIGAAILAFLLLLPMTGWMFLPVASPGCAATEDASMTACALACARMGMACPMQKQHRQSCSCQVTKRPTIAAVMRVQATAPEPSEASWIGAAPGARLVPAASNVPLAGFSGPIDHPPPPSC